MSGWRVRNRTWRSSWPACMKTTQHTNKWVAVHNSLCTIQTINILIAIDNSDFALTERGLDLKDVPILADQLIFAVRLQLDSHRVQ